MNIECTFDKDDKLINIGPWDYRPSEDDEGNAIVRNPLPEGAYSVEREVFEDADGSRYLAKDALLEGERWIADFFSTARLLQMKVWLDELPSEDTPKLRDVYNWTGDVTAAAAAGQTSFPAPPHLFSEVVEEAMTAAQSQGRITQY
jgi:hypothetical protein